MLVWLLVSAFAIAAGPDLYAPAEPAPTVREAEMDLIDGRLIVAGEHFGTAMPLVIVDGIPLELASWTPTEITAGLSTEYVPGSACRIEVYRGPLMDAYGMLTINAPSVDDPLQTPQ